MEQNSSINLLPDQGRGPSTVTDQQRVSFAIAIAILGLTALVAVLVEGGHIFLDQLNSSYLSRITDDKQQLSGLQSTEVLYRSIDTKLGVLQGLLTSYPYNSKLLDDVASLTPSGVRLTNLSLDNLGKVSVIGESKGPDAFGQFVNILRDPNQGGKKFSGVDVAALTGNGKDNTYNFTLTMLHQASASGSATAAGAASP